MPRKAKYRWVVVFRNGKRRDEPVATGYREAMWFACVHSGRNLSDVAEVQRHLTGDEGFIYRSWRFR